MRGLIVVTILILGLAVQARGRSCDPTCHVLVRR